MKLFIQGLVLICVLITSTVNANLLQNGNFDDVDANIDELYYSTYGQTRLLTELGDWDCGTYTCTGALDDDNLKKYSDGNPRIKNWGIYDTIPFWQTISNDSNDNAIEVIYSDDDSKNSPIDGVAAQSGNLFVELDLDLKGLKYNSAIGQTLNGLIEGMFYELSFFYQPRTDGADDNGINLYWFDGGLSAFDYDEDIVLSANSNTIDWVNVSGKDSGGWKKYSDKFEATSEEMSIAFSGFGFSNGLGGFIDTASVTQVPEPKVLALMLVGFLGFAVRKKVLSRS